MNKELLISNLRFSINVVFDLYHVISGGGWNTWHRLFYAKSSLSPLTRQNLNESYLP
jgi:hypothetical protein